MYHKNTVCQTDVTICVDSQDVIVGKHCKVTFRMTVSTSQNLTSHIGSCYQYVNAFRDELSVSALSQPATSVRVLIRLSFKLVVG